MQEMEYLDDLPDGDRVVELDLSTRPRALRTVLGGLNWGDNPGESLG